jgi:hypothetical protein
MTARTSAAADRRPKCSFPGKAARLFDCAGGPGNALHDAFNARDPLVDIPCVVAKAPDILGKRFDVALQSGDILLKKDDLPDACEDVPDGAH